MMAYVFMNTLLKLHLQMEYYDAWNLAEQQQNAVQEKEHVFYRAWDEAEKQEQMYKDWDAAEKIQEDIHRFWADAENFVKKTKEKT